ncbi:MAG: hypothetical protein JSS66_05975 [Armatimonadetes bacterium]|nr:hypothetical protein [Armatimonadota bacterium]
MSHFSVCALVPTLVVDGGGLEKHLEQLLEPYSENREVEPYMAKCHCVGSVASKEAREKADSEYGTIEALRTAFSATTLPDGRVVADMQKRSQDLMFSQQKLSKDERAEYKTLDAELDALWAAHMGPRKEAEERYFNEHPDKDKPDPGCGFYKGERADWWPADVKEGDRYEDESGCAGTGEYETTYNPQSKWDWYVVGGRWNGWLAPEGKKPEDDPDNWETCKLCGGSGVRKDGVALANPDQMVACKGCNGCNGTGKNIKWPTMQKDSGYNVVSPRYFETLAMLDPDEGLPTPYAFVTPDGEWHEKGQMGWWGMSNDKVAQTDWQETWRKALLDHTTPFDDFSVIVIDCHI